MNSYFSLTKAFIKSLSMSSVTGKKKIGFWFILSLIVIFIFLPFLLGTSLFTYIMTNDLASVDYQDIGISLLCIILSIFIFIFSFNVILNELYFNDNIEHILPLPLKPFQIVASKFSSCFFAENIMSFLIIIFGIIGYLFAIGFKFSNFLIGVIGALTLPIVPMVYTGIICLIIMYFTRFIKNKETVRQFSMILVFIVLFLFVFSITKIQQFDFDSYIESFALGNHGFLNVMNYIFPNIKYFVDAMNSNYISLLIYLVINIIFVIVYLFLSNYLYFGGVIDLNSKDNSVKTSSRRLYHDIKSSSQMMSYINKEFKILFRTPSYFINCIVINMIWPIFVYAIFKILNYTDFLEFSDLINKFDYNTLIIYFMLVIGVSIIVPCISTISSSSFSREGKHFDFIKYIPVHYNIIIFSKIFVSFIISFIGIVFYMSIFFIVYNVNIIICLLSYLLIIVVSLLISLFGVLIDSIQPKLVWDDPLNALRENYNNFIVMGVGLLLLFISIFIGYKFINISLCYFNYYYFLILLIFIVFDVITYFLIRNYCIDNIRNQEEL